MVHIARHQQRALPPAPASWDGSVGCTFPLYANDRYGNCTVVALAHQLHMQAVREGRPLQFSEAEVVDFYLGLTGGVDDGLVEVDVLHHARERGFPLSGAHKLAAWAALDRQDREHVKSAAALFTGIYVGVAMPLTAKTQHEWDVLGPLTGDAAPESWGGHSMMLCAYDERGVTFATWGLHIRATWAWWHAYIDQAYVWLDAERAAVAGVCWSDLVAELETMASSRAAAANGQRSPGR